MIDNLPILAQLLGYLLPLPQMLPCYNLTAHPPPLQIARAVAAGSTGTPAAAVHLCGAGSWSEVSLRELLQSGVFCLQLPQPPDAVGLHPTVLVPPPIPGCLADLQMAKNLGQILAVVEQALALACAPPARVCASAASSWSVSPRPTSQASGFPQKIVKHAGAQLTHAVHRWM